MYKEAAKQCSNYGGEGGMGDDFPPTTYRQFVIPGTITALLVLPPSHP